MGSEGRCRGERISHIQILLADDDADYVSALVRFLMGRGEGYGIRTYTDEASFAEDLEGIDWSEFDLALMGSSYLEILKEEDLLGELRRKVGHPLQLLLEGEEGDFRLNAVDKYQPMDYLLDLLGKTRYSGLLQLREEGHGVMSAFTGELLAISYQEENQRRDQGFLAIYSPMHHELLLPFTLLLCRDMAREGAVILIDLQENSRLFDYSRRHWQGTLTDYLYARVHGEGSLQDFLFYEDNLAILAPVDSPMELGRIEEEQWALLLEELEQSQARVVLLYDSFHQGAQLMLSACRQMFLLGKGENYYRRLTQRCEQALRQQFPRLDLECLELPLSLGQHMQESLRLEEIEAGNLGNYVRGQSCRWSRCHAERSVG